MSDIKSMFDSRLTVFISSPYRAITQENVDRNLANAKKYCRLAYEAGYAPFAPHLHNPYFMTDDDKWMDCGKAMMLRCDEIWVFTHDGISDGMFDEIMFAYRNNLTMHFVDVQNGSDGMEKIEFRDDSMKTYLKEHASDKDHDEHNHPHLRKYDSVERLARIIFTDSEFNSSTENFIRLIRERIELASSDHDMFYIEGKNLIEMLDAILLDDTGSRLNPMYRLVNGLTGGEFAKCKKPTENVIPIKSVATGVPKIATPPNFGKAKCCGTCAEYSYPFVTCEKFHKRDVGLMDVCDEHRFGENGD